MPAVVDHVLGAANYRPLRENEARLRKTVAELRLSEEALRKSNEELSRARTELEKRVQERTADLTAANSELECQMKERNRLENELLDIAENERRRIGFDLHDDIGSSLSQVAILSEAARRESANSTAADTMAQVASISREVVDSMSDIVWAINPQRDYVRDLVQRMRRFASDVLAAKDIEFTFLAPPEGFDRRLPADVRRQILLVFKEAVNNLARHSGASQARTLYSYFSEFRYSSDPGSRATFSQSSYPE